jgi:hydroxymethylpyrimidine/phosphomethylpyrimidine kinase
LGKKGIILSIAGFDPTGGAGVLLDVKVFSLFGFKGAGIPATLTLQNTSTFKGWEAVSPEYLKRSLELIFSDLPVLGIKIGMIGTSENIKIFKSLLKEKKIPWIVLDPVLKATLNYHLFSSSEFIKTLKTELLPLVDVITPNVYEAELLTEKSIKTKKELLALTRILLDYGPKAVIITGWEESGYVWDLFFSREKNFYLKRKKLKGTFHGTGCAFSSALLSYLVSGLSIEEAFKKAKNWLYLKLKKAEEEKIGGKLWLFL